MSGTPGWLRKEQSARAAEARLSSAAAWVATVDDGENEISDSVIGLFWHADGAMAACLDNHRSYLQDDAAQLVFEQEPNSNQHTATYNPGPCIAPVTYEVTQLPIQ